MQQAPRLLFYFSCLSFKTKEGEEKGVVPAFVDEEDEEDPLAGVKSLRTSWLKKSSTAHSFSELKRVDTALTFT